MNPEKCEFCVHWVYWRKRKDHKIGHCLRYPPMLNTAKGEWENPKVWNDHRCGEHKDGR